VAKTKVPPGSKLLDHAWSLLEPGGTLVFATCSLETEEGEAQITAFLSRTPNARLASATPQELGGWAEIITPEGHIRALPAHLAAQGGCDGFFASRLVKA